MKKVRLGDIAKFQNGKAFKSEQWHEKGLPIIRIQNLNDPHKDFNYHSGEIKQKYHVSNGDILISWSASLGVYEWDRGNAYLNQHIFKTIFKRDDIDKNYFKYMLNLRIQQVEKHLRGSTMKHINKGDFEDLKIPLPSLKIQKRIASILDKAEILLQKRQLSIEKLDELIQHIFLDMFGDPSINPKNWPLKKIGEVCHTVKDGPHKSLNYVESGIPFLSVNNIINDEWDLDEVRYISEENFNKYKKRCEPKKGDVLYTKGGTTGFAKYIDIDFTFLNWVHLAVLKFDHSEIDGRFLATMLNSDFCYKQSQKFTRGIANRDLVLSQIKRIEIIKPPLKKQKAFAERVKRIKKLKKHYQDSAYELENLFNSLHQRAFNGYLNFKEIEEQLLAAEPGDKNIA